MAKIGRPKSTCNQSAVLWQKGEYEKFKAWMRSKVMSDEERELIGKVDIEPMGISQGIRLLCLKSLKNEK